MRKPASRICKQQRGRSAAHTYILISTVVVSYIDSITLLISLSEIPSLNLASLVILAGLCLTWTEDRFFATGLIYVNFILSVYDHI